MHRYFSLTQPISLINPQKSKHSAADTDSTHRIWTSCSLNINIKCINRNSSPSQNNPPRNSPELTIRASASDKILSGATQNKPMASSVGGGGFPPQHQSEQPGLEYIMDPLPQFSNPNYKPANKLQGKVALVTGGDSGIGRAVCYHFSLEGATVAFTYVKPREERDAGDTLEIIRKAKSAEAKDPIAIPTDVGFDENCKRVVDEVVGAFGRIDILVNNAAEQREVDSPEEIEPESLDRVFRTNIYAHFFMIRHALKHMKEGSCIINTASVIAYAGSSKLLEYAATKGAVVAFTRSLALTLIGRGIRVNAVAPGPIWTPLIPSSLTVDQVVSFGTNVTMGRAGQPCEVAPSYVFLASNADSSYFTGQVLHPNGGIIVNA